MTEPTRIRTICSKCRHPQEYSPHDLGKKGRCRACGIPYTIGIGTEWTSSTAADDVPDVKPDDPSRGPSTVRPLRPRDRRHPLPGGVATFYAPKPAPAVLRAPLSPAKAALLTAAVLGLGGAVAIPAYVHARLASNELKAREALVAIQAAEQNFKRTDADANGENDYWTADVAGLYCLTAGGKPLAVLADPAIARADVYRLDDAGGTYRVGDLAYAHDAIRGTREPRDGYWFQALGDDPQGNPYAADTDGRGACHNATQFGFAAIPAAWDSTGNDCFIARQFGPVLRRSFGGATAVPRPGHRTTTFDGGAPLDWPSAAELATWSKVE